MKAKKKTAKKKASRRSRPVEALPVFQAPVSEKSGWLMPTVVILAIALVIAFVGYGIRHNKPQPEAVNPPPQPVMQTHQPAEAPKNPFAGVREEAARQAALAQKIATPAAAAATTALSFSDFLKPVESKEAIHKVDLKTAAELYTSNKAVFIDARGAAAFAQGHIRGAHLVDAAQLAQNPAKYKRMFRNKMIITYCSGASCHLSDKLAMAFFDQGFRQLGIFFDGWHAWTKAKYAMATGEYVEPQAAVK